MLLGEDLLARVEVPFCFWSPTLQLLVSLGIWNYCSIGGPNQIRPGSTSTRIYTLHTCHNTGKKIQEQVSVTMQKLSSLPVPLEGAGREIFQLLVYLEYMHEFA